MSIGQIKHYIKFWKDRIRKCKEYGWTYALDGKYRKYIEKRADNIKNHTKYGYTYENNKRYIKQILFQRDGNICFWCNRKMEHFTATIDHIEPVCNKPKNNRLDNLRLIHSVCRAERDKAILKN